MTSGYKPPYPTDNALKKLEAMDDQIADVQDDLDTKAEHMAQLKRIMKSYWEKGDEALIPIMVGPGLAYDSCHVINRVLS